MRKLKSRINKFAQYYSPKLRIDIPYFLKGGVWLALGQISNVLKLFILSFVFANFLSKEIYGQYSFIMAVLGIAAIFSLPGMFNAIIKSVAQGNEGTYFKGLRKVFKWSWLGSLFLLGFSIYGWLIGREFGSVIFLILASVYPFYAISGYYVAFFNGKKLFDIQIKISSIFNIISTILIILAIIISKNVFYIVFTTVFAQILIQGFFSIKLVKNYLENRETDKKSLKFGRKTSFSLAFSNFAFRLDLLVVTYFLGFEGLAIYSIITLLPNGLKNLSNIFTPLFLPKLANNKIISKQEIMTHFKKLMFFSLILVILYYIFAPFIFKYIYPSYLDYVWLSIIFGLSFIVFPSIIINLYFINSNNYGNINFINNLCSIYLVIGSVSFILFFGLIGAVINRIIYRFLSLITHFYLFKKN